jgi:hypothetical protein
MGAAEATPAANGRGRCSNLLRLRLFLIRRARCRVPCLLTHGCAT